MRNFFYRVSSAVARFMYGRNGIDQLNVALWVAYVLMMLPVRTFLGRASLGMALEAVLVLLILFRTFSKNLSKRQAENEKFLRWWMPVKNRVIAAHSRSRDKEHKYFTCKSCKTICRVPAGKGKIEITCPKCGGKIMGKS